MKHAVSPQPRPSARNAALLRRSFLVAALRAGAAGAYTVKPGETLYRLA
ncbi:LysM peptidoglycan-binding domain-containing protein [Deinococcus sp. YIM 77859]|nr:LysM peptidoglycan-binding domain-containing protein [Deinococcus sp. YIM 77859]